jgi:osmotically-inducible protein OsmY
MKTDAELKKDVIDELSWDPEVASTAIGVAVKDGIVTVSGHLDTYAQRFAVERALQRVHGVKAIALELDVKLSPQHKQSDTEIAEAVEQSLKRTTLSAHRVWLTVEGGFVTLHGELDWEYERQSVERAIRPLLGVVGISNEITLKPRPVPADITERITGALQRQALHEAKRIHIDVDGSTVTLQGQVHSWRDRNAIQAAAWAVQGVQSVNNELRVTP